jgi:hypothetical protein
VSVTIIAMKLTDVLATLRAEHRRITGLVDTLDSAIGVLSRLGGGRAAGARKTRTISAAGRARIAAAQRARWAKVQGRKVVSVARKGRTMSAAARKRIVTAQKARWAKWRKEHQ